MAQFAFEDSMIHVVLQFTLRIAVCCVLHRCKSQDIHRYELCLVRFFSVCVFDRPGCGKHAHSRSNSTRGYIVMKCSKGFFLVVVVVDVASNVNRHKGSSG